MDGEGSGKNERVRTVVAPATIKAFLAGLVLGNINKRLLLGFTLGVIGGVFVQQNFGGVPDVAITWKDLMKRWNKTGGGSNSER